MYLCLLDYEGAHISLSSTFKSIKLLQTVTKFIAKRNKMVINGLQIMCVMTLKFNCFAYLVFARKRQLLRYSRFEAVIYD